MKPTCLFLFILLAISMLSAGTQTDWQKMELKGRVESIITDADVFIFNPQGMIVNGWRGDERYASEEYHYVYDDNMNLLSKEKNIVNSYVTSGDYYTYDDAGRLIKHKDYSLSNTYYYYYTYDSSGRISRKQTHDFYDKPASAVEYIYNAEGKTIKENHFDKGGKLSHYVQYTYDKAGNNTEKGTYEPNKKLIFKSVHKFNAQNQISEEQVYREKSLTYKSLNTYDEHGNIAEKKVNDFANNSSYTLSFRYTYDEQGNWTTKVCENNGKKNYSENRSIVYYR